MTRTLAIIGVFVALALSGLIYFLINRVQTDSLEELRFQARKEGIPLSTNDLYEMGLWEKPDASSKAFVSLFDHLRNDQASQSFLSSEVQKTYGFLNTILTSKESHRESVARPMLMLESKLTELIDKATAASRYDDWRPALGESGTERDLLNLARVCQGLSAFAIAHAAVGEWPLAESYLGSALQLATCLFGRPIVSGVVIGTLALTPVYEAIATLHRIAQYKTESMHELRAVMDRPLPSVPGATRFLTHMAIQYEWSFGNESRLRQFEKSTVKLSSSDLERAETAWLTGMLKIKSDLPKDSDLQSWIQNMGKHSQPVDAATSKLYDVVASQFPVRVAEPGTGFFQMAERVLTPIGSRQLELESSRRKVYRLVWGDS